MSEWLCANGLGSYASGTSSDRLTRRYHGLFVAALQPPLGRRVLLSKLDASIDYADRHADLSSNQWRDGTVSPRGDRYALGTVMDGRVAVTTYAFADATLERRIWMEYGTQQSNMHGRCSQPARRSSSTLKAYVNDRDYHGTTHAFACDSVVSIEGSRARIALAGTPWYLHAQGATSIRSSSGITGFDTSAKRSGASMRARISMRH